MLIQVWLLSIADGPYSTNGVCDQLGLGNGEDLEGFTLLLRGSLYTCMMYDKMGRPSCPTWRDEEEDRAILTYHLPSLESVTQVLTADLSVAF